MTQMSHWTGRQSVRCVHRAGALDADRRRCRCATRCHGHIDASGRVYCRWFPSISIRARGSCSARARSSASGSSRASSVHAHAARRRRGRRRGRPRRRRRCELLEAAGIAVVAVSRLRGESRQRDGRSRARASPSRSASIRSSRLGGGSSLDCAKGINFVLTNGGSDRRLSRLRRRRRHAAAADDRHPDHRRHGKRSAELRGDLGRGHAHEDGVRRSVGRGAGRASRSRTHAHGAASRHRDGRFRRDRARRRNGGDYAGARRCRTRSPTTRGGCCRTRSSACCCIPRIMEARAAMQVGCALRGHGDRAVDARRGSRLRESADRALQPAARTGARHPAAACRPLERRRGERSLRAAARLSSPPLARRDGAETIARRLEDFALAGGLAARLSDVGVEESAIPELAAQAAEQWTGTFNPRPFDAAGAAEVYRTAF